MLKNPTKNEHFRPRHRLSWISSRHRALKSRQRQQQRQHRIFWRDSRAVWVSWILEISESRRPHRLKSHKSLYLHHHQLPCLPRRHQTLLCRVLITRRLEHVINILKWLLMSRRHYPNEIFRGKIQLRSLISIRVWWQLRRQHQKHPEVEAKRKQNKKHIQIRKCRVSWWCRWKLQIFHRHSHLERLEIRLASTTVHSVYACLIKTLPMVRPRTTVDHCQIVVRLNFIIL